MRKVELLPTRDCEVGYGPGSKLYCFCVRVYTVLIFEFMQGYVTQMC